MNKVYLVVGVPGSGKTTVCKQLTDKFEYIPHDYHKTGYLEAILKAHKDATKPLLIETPFSISALMQPLMEQRITVIPVFITETAEIVTKRYEAREGKPIHKGHLTRLETFKQRAKELKAFQGTSEEVLNHLKGI